MGNSPQRRNRRLGILIGVTVGLVTLAVGEADASVATAPPSAPTAIVTE